MDDALAALHPPGDLFFWQTNRAERVVPEFDDAPALHRVAAH